MADNAQTNDTNVGAPETDYKALYEQTLARAETAEAEAKKQKGLKDTYATENAEYKRQEADRKKQELESLPEVERLTKELEAERIARKADTAEIAKLKLERDFSAQGFSAEETAKIIDGNFAPKDIADIIKARVDEGVKSAKAEATKASTADGLLGNGTANKGDGKSDFQKHQESKQNQSTIVEL
ncbi:MAG: hypothetical protein J6J71_04545 [Prevotella sp.]|nr:hypothetical protein [Prevotella sp.]